MKDKGNSERQRAYRARQKAKGLTLVREYVPKAAVAVLRQYAEKLRKEMK